MRFFVYEVPCVATYTLRFEVSRPDGKTTGPGVNKEVRAMNIFVTNAVLAILLAAQLTLGWFTVTKRKPADIASYHVAGGAMILYVTFTVAVRSRRLAGPRSARSSVACS